MLASAGHFHIRYVIMCYSRFVIKQVWREEVQLIRIKDPNSGLLQIFSSFLGTEWHVTLRFPSMQ